MYLEQRLDKVVEGVDRQALNITQLFQELKTLRTDFQDSVQYEKQIYTTKDLAGLLNNSVDHVRKNFIVTGKVKAEKTIVGYEISKDEFLRVKEIVMTRGKHYL